MPIYDYFCERCEQDKEVTHGMNEKPDIICDCGEIMKKAISKGIQFVLKGSGWTGKDLREKNYRLKRRQEVGKRMVKSHDLPQVQPNYKGEVCKTWDDAGKLAKADGINPIRYENQVKNLKETQMKVKEKNNKLVRGDI